MPVSLTGLSASNSAENEWCANAAPESSMHATNEAASVRTFIVRSSESIRRIVRGLRPIVLTEIDGQFAFDPLELPAARPRLRVGAGVVDGYFVLERVVVGAREALDERELVRVRQPAVREPEVLVEAGRAHDERVAFPVRDRAAVVERVVVVALHLALLIAAIHVDDAVVAIAAADQNEDALARRILNELHTVRRLELPHGARVLAVQEARVVGEMALLAVLVKTERPRLKRRDSRRVGEPREHAVGVHSHVGAILLQHGARRIRPVAAARIGYAEHWLAVCAARHGLLLRARHGRRRVLDVVDLTAVGERDARSPDLPRAVARHGAAGTHGIARLQRIVSPAAAKQQHRALELDGPVLDAAVALGLVDEDVHV